jgi:hypothetical protein
MEFPLAVGSLGCDFFATDGIFGHANHHMLADDGQGPCQQPPTGQCLIPEEGAEERLRQ